MKKMVLIGALLLSGCYKTTITMGGSPGSDIDVKSHGVFYGLVTLNEIDAQEICGDKGVYSVVTQHTVGDSILNFLTGALYTPVTVVVTCKG